MKKNMFQTMLLWIKETTLFRQCERFYGWIIHILFKGKWMSMVLAYGGFHLLLLLLLGCQAVYMWNESEKNNVTSFNQLIYKFEGDTLHNYRLNYLHFEKDMMRRPGNTYNGHDIDFYYGFVRNDTENRETAIKQMDWKGAKKECHLISKVRNVSCNDLPDTLSNRKRHVFNTKTQQIYNTTYISNHDRYYYDISTKEDSTHIFHHITNANDHLIEWDKLKPCFSFWIGIIIDDSIELNEKSVIKIKFNDFERDFSSTGVRRPLIVERVSPQPTKSDLQEIVYTGEELKTVIKQHGIFVSGVDPEKKEIVEKKNWRSTVILGVIIAFMLDIIVQLVLKWRKLQEYKEIQ